MKQQESELLAAKIVKMLQAESQPLDLADLQESVNKIDQRLENLERAMLAAKGVSAQRYHPSIDKFSVAETVTDGVLSGLGMEKACQFEPDKPCDHCSMCNSRGF